VLAHGHHQHALADLTNIGGIDPWFNSFRQPPDYKRRNDQRRNCAQGRQRPRLEPHPPPAPALLRQSRRNLLPHALAVIRAGIGCRQRIQRRENGFDPLQLRTTLFTDRQML